MSYLLRADQVPPPVAPTQTPLASGCTSSSTTAPVSIPFYSGANLGVCALNLNSLQTALFYLATYGGLGYGVVTGLSFATGAGIGLPVTAGAIVSGGYVEFAASTVVLADDSTNYVWALQNGTLTSGVSTTAPTATAVYLGQAVTVAGAITSVDFSGVVYLKPGLAERNTGDRGAPKDTPPVGVRLVTKTGAGTYLWDGATHKAQGTPVLTLTLSADLTLDAYDPPDLVLTSSSAKNVKLPATPAFGQRTTIRNANASGGANIVVKDSTGATTIVTLTPGQTATVPAVVSSTGSPKYATTGVSAFTEA